MIELNDLVPGFIFAGVLAIVALAAALLPGSSGTSTRRIRRVTQRFHSGSNERPAEADGTPSLLIGSTKQGFAGALERAIVRLVPRPEELRLKLMRAGLSQSPGRFATCAAVLGLVAGVTVVAVWRSPALALAVGIAVAFGLPNLWLSTRIRKRKRRFAALFPEAVELMVRGLKSGVPVGQTVISVGQEIRDPIGPEFQRIADSASLGVSLVDALWDAARRVDVPEFRFFVVAVAIQRETGGNLGETLENLADILRKRLQMQLKVKAMSSEARSSAMIIGALPFVMFGLLMMLNPDYMLKLVYDPRGQIIAGGGLFLMALGAFVMSRMVKFEI
jgi:tight adherence protein B